MGGGHDEREQTLNQLLSEMDGFDSSKGILILGATNRPEILDKALLRPGRFDRQVYVNLPDVRGREAILRVHARNKPMAPDVNFKTVARITAGFSGADLANLLNEAAILAARANKKLIGNLELYDGINKVLMGPQKKSRVVTEADCAGLCHRDYPECDALVTATPGVALLVFTADCTPILLHDPVTGAVGAAHAGWRGTAAAIAARTVEAMCREFGSRPSDIRAAIGPNIGQCHFETDADVPEAMVSALGDAANAHITQKGEKYYVNLKEINALFLRRAGVERIEISKACTMCAPDRFWSHRVTHGDRGSQGAIIVCR